MKFSSRIRFSLPAASLLLLVYASSAFAAMGERAECVMLNKGPHIVEAITSLADILLRMEAHQHKKRSMLRKLHW